MISSCFNPNCLHPEDPENITRSHCPHCGTALALGDRYRNLQILSHSQFALTVDIYDPQTETNKIVKILLSEYPKAKSLFAQEAHILQNIHHTGIPKIKPEDYFISQDVGWLLYRPCIVMEKIEGISLAQWLEQEASQPLSIAQIHNWLIQLTEILEQLHTQSFFHRDLKPSNILLKPNGQLVLIDFGAAREITDTYLGKVGGRQDLTCIGTPGYMSPEQMEGSALPQSDFFALGRTIVHLLTQKHPLELPKHPEKGNLMWHSAAPTLPKDLADLIDQMMSPLPGHRPANTQVIRQQLDTLSLNPSSPHTSLKPSTLKQRATWFQSFSTLQHPSTVTKSLRWILPLSLSLGALAIIINRFLVPSPSASKPSPTVVTCQNTVCANRDAVDNECHHDVQTLTSNVGNFRKSKNYLKAYRVELRYSKACQSTWVRDEAPAQSVHYVEDRSGRQYGTSTIPVDGNPNHYSDMGPGQGTKIRACAHPPKEKVTCTSFVDF
jgi:serine/threonine protein kinase